MHYHLDTDGPRSSADTAVLSLLLWSCWSRSFSRLFHKRLILGRVLPICGNISPKCVSSTAQFFPNSWVFSCVLRCTIAIHRHGDPTPHTSLGVVPSMCPLPLSLLLFCLSLSCIVSGWGGATLQFTLIHVHRWFTTVDNHLHLPPTLKDLLTLSSWPIRCSTFHGTAWLLNVLDYL